MMLLTISMQAKEKTMNKKDQEDKETLKIQEWREYYMKTGYLKDE